MFHVVDRGQEGRVLPSKKGVFMRIALSLRKLGLTSDVLHGLGFGSMLAAISLWGRSAGVSDWRAKARSERLAIFVGLWPPTFFLLGKVMQDLEASPAQQVLRARGVEESQLDDALRHEAAAVPSSSEQRRRSNHGNRNSTRRTNGADW